MIRALPPALLLAVALSACGDKGPLPEKPTSNIGQCTYTNGFSKRPECREYRGDQWTQAEAEADCQGQGATLVVGGSCTYADTIGQCVLGEAGRYTWITMPGTDVSWCGSSKTGCEFFGGGIFGPSALCGADAGSGGLAGGLTTFQWPEKVCKAPLPGEPPGASDGGLVCTWEMISGATELGRDFDQYASCDRVRTQRPYYPRPTEPNAEREDPRLADAGYALEVAWLKSEIRSTACVCCHSTKAPQGTSNWYVDQPGNFLNGFHARGLAMGAGWIDTVGFGTFPPEENNGYIRADPQHPELTIFPTHDPARVKRIFEGELAARGFKRTDFPAVSYGAGPLDEQRFFVPTACTGGEGVAADGTVTWKNGPARYVYVLEGGTPSPGVPPNLDLPPGTLWRVDAPWTLDPVASGAVKYGTAPAGFVTRAPATGAPARLVSGRQYYLYVLADIAVPATRCLFTAP